MICAQCKAELEADERPSCGHEPLLRGRYRLEELLGRGLGGRTYRATDLESGAEVAVKELLLAELDDLEAIDRFEQEADLLARLDTPTIARYLDAFRASVGGSTGLYLIRELVVGEPLDVEMRHRRFTAAETLELMAEILEALDQVHGCIPPIIHRDVKPSNVIRRASDRALVVIDFGAAKELRSARTEPGSALVGTYGYMAPERFAGRSHPGSDTYSVAMLGLTLVTGLAPEELAARSQRRAPTAGFRMPRPLRRLFDDMLEPGLDRRSTEAAALADRCRRLSADLAAGPAVKVLPRSAAGPRWRLPLAAAAALSLGVLATLGATLNDPPEPAPEPTAEAAEPAIPDGSDCERSGTCHGLGQGIGGFVLDHDECPTSRETVEGLRSGRLFRSAVDVDVTLVDQPRRCFAYSYNGAICSLRCDLGVGQVEGASYRLGEVRERRRAVLEELRDTFGRESGHLDQESRQGYGRQMTWTWREGPYNLLLTHQDFDGDDDELRPTTAGSQTTLELRYTTSGPRLP